MAKYVISGVTRGIGRELAVRLIADGHEVFGLIRTADSVVCPGLADVGIADLEHPESLSTSLAPLVAGLDLVDGLVHCAGIVRPGPLAAAVPREFSEHFAVNVTAVAELTRLLLPQVRAAGGTIVFVNSGSGLNAHSPLGAYAASKFALRAYADALRGEEPSVRVSTVYPGRTSTDMQRVVRSAEGGEYDEANYLRPKTVAAVIASVLSLPSDGVITDLSLRPRTH